MPNARLRSGLRPSLRHTTRTVPQLSHECWYRNREGVNHHKFTYRYAGLDYRLTGVEEGPKVVTELLA